jgi:hypothetical protein
MNKKLIFALALSAVFVSGAFYSAQAACGFNLCGIHLPSCFSLCGNRDKGTAENTSKDMDKGTVQNAPRDMQSDYNDSAGY